MYTQAAETIWSSLTEKLNDCNHILTLAKFGLESFLQSFQTRNFYYDLDSSRFALNLSLFFRIAEIVEDHPAR